MPPKQPVHRCQGACGLLRPCKSVGGRWLCVECNPFVDVDDQEDLENVDVEIPDQIDDGVEPPTAEIVADGGSE
jgi:hypothetical protein